MSVGHSSATSVVSADELPQELPCQPSDCQPAQAQDVPVRVENIPKQQSAQAVDVLCGATVEVPESQSRSLPSVCADIFETQKCPVGEVCADPPEKSGSKSEADALPSEPSPLSAYLPVMTPQSAPLAESSAESGETSGNVAQQLQASGISAQQRICGEQDGTESAESRALSKKRQTLAKVAQEQANTRKERFVFGRPSTTPTRKKNLKLTPVRKPEPPSVASPPVEQEASGN
jgi:hypothetical protein